MRIVRPEPKTPIIYYFRPDRWYAYFMFLLKKWVDSYHQGDIDCLTYAEQVIYRKSVCIRCKETNKAECCNCDFRGKIMQQSESCGYQMWPKMMPKAEWEKYKFLNNINIKI